LFCHCPEVNRDFLTAQHFGFCTTGVS